MGPQEVYEVSMLNSILPTLDLIDDKTEWDFIFDGWQLTNNGEYLICRQGLQQRGYYMRYFDEPVRQKIYDYFGYKRDDFRQKIYNYFGYIKGLRGLL